MNRWISCAEICDAELYKIQDEGRQLSIVRSSGAQRNRIPIDCRNYISRIQSRILRSTALPSLVQIRSLLKIYKLIKMAGGSDRGTEPATAHVYSVRREMMMHITT